MGFLPISASFDLYPHAEKQCDFFFPFESYGAKKYSDPNFPYSVLMYHYQIGEKKMSQGLLKQLLKTF